MVDESKINTDCREVGTSNRDVNDDAEKRIMQAYSQDVSQHQLLSPEDEYELGILIQMGDQKALHKMVESNLRLVINIASKYRGRGVELIDMISEGNLGLIRAAEKFNPHLGFRFSTYATFWIKQFIERGIMNTSRLIRLPVHVVKELNQILVMQKKLNNKYKSRIIKVEDIARELDKPVDRVIELLTIHDCLTYNESIIKDDEDSNQSSFSDSYKDNASEPHEIVEEELINKILNIWLDAIEEDSQVVLSMRYGIRGYSAMSMADIAQELDIDIDEVRRIQRRGLKQLKDIRKEKGAVISDFVDK